MSDFQEYKEKSWPDFVDIRFYKTGWTFRVFSFICRWNHQKHYSALSLEKVTSNFQEHSGMSWKQYKQFKQSQKEKNKNGNV
jgi:hypothetical protein